MGLMLSSVKPSSVNQLAGKNNSSVGCCFIFLHVPGDGTVGGHLSSGITVKPQTAEWPWPLGVDCVKSNETECGNSLLQVQPKLVVWKGGFVATHERQ